MQSLDAFLGGGKAQKEKMVNLYNLQKNIEINRKFACGKSCGKCE